MESTTDLVTRSVGDLNVENAANKNTFWQMTLKEKISYIKEIITVEPLIAAYISSAILLKLPLNVLEYEKACRASLDLNDTVCDTIISSTELVYPEEIQNIQVVIGRLHSWQYPIQSLMPLILVLFLGSYSDRHQWRKPFLILPLIGELFSVAGCILSVTFMKSWTLNVQGLVQTVIPSLFGGQTMLVMAVFAYIADVSAFEMRTLRIGIVQIVMNACVPTVQSFSALVFAALGYTGTLLIAGFLYLMAIIYGLFWIKEPKRPIRDPKKNILADIFDLGHAIDTIKLILKKDPANNRLLLVLIMLGMFVYAFVNDGEETVFFLYSRAFLQWSDLEYTSFLTINTLIHLVGTIIAVPVFTKVLKLQDVTILFFTFMDKIVANVIFGFGRTTVLMYVAATVSLITGVTGVSIRSLATKVVAQKDLGKAQSLFGIVEVIAPAVAAPVYNAGIYVHTYEIMPSGYFFFSALVYVAYVFIIIWIFIYNRRENSVKEGRCETKNGTKNTIDDRTIAMENIQITHM